MCIVLCNFLATVKVTTSVVNRERQLWEYV